MDYSCESDIHTKHLFHHHTYEKLQQYEQTQNRFHAQRFGSLSHYYRRFSTECWVTVREGVGITDQTYGEVILTLMEAWSVHSKTEGNPTLLKRSNYAPAM